MKTWTLLIFYLWMLRLPAQEVTWTPWKRLVPSDKIPADTYKGNNNLDVIRHQGRFYLAFRSAPSHFASRKTKLFVLSSPDRENWTLEKEIHIGSDLREPRFAVLHDSLFFFCFQAGKHPLKFEPQKVWACQQKAPGQWTELQDLHLDGYIPWRIRSRDGLLYMSAYYGVGIYQQKKRQHRDVRLFTSKDGYHWSPISEQAQVFREDAEEGEFIFDKKGNIWGTVRLEGQGALVFFAHRDSLDKWQVHPTKKKYDSALLFRNGEDIYLVSRRNIDGDMARNPAWLPTSWHDSYNLARYSLTLKVTSLFKLDKTGMKMRHVADFPSTGDTAFPGILSLGKGKFWLLNYSSNFKKDRRSWIIGQLGKTYIYETELTIH